MYFLLFNNKIKNLWDIVHLENSKILFLFYFKEQKDFHYLFKKLV